MDLNLKEALVIKNTEPSLKFTLNPDVAVCSLCKM